MTKKKSICSYEKFIFHFHAYLFRTGFCQQKTFSLKEAQDYAVNNNKELKAADLDIEASQKEVKEVRAIGLPQVNGEGSFQYFMELPTTLIPAQFFNPQAPPDQFQGVQFGTEFNVTGSITLSQLIFDGSYLTGLKAAKKYPTLSKRLKEKTELQVKNDVALAYYAAIVAKENRAVLDKTSENTAKLVEDAKAFLETGFSDSTAYEQFQLMKINVDNMRNKSRREEQVAKNLLKMQMGMAFSDSIELSETLVEFINGIGASDVISMDFDPSNSPDHKVMQTQLELQQLNLEKEKSAYYPSVGAFFQHQEQAMRNDLDIFEGEAWYPSTILGVNLNVPIFSSGQRHFKVQKAEIELKKTAVQLENLDQGLELQAERAVIQFKSAFESFVAQQKQVELSRKIMRRTGIKYNAGTENIMNLTQTQNQYLEALNNYVMAMYQLVSAKAEVDRIYNTYK